MRRRILVLVLITLFPVSLLAQQPAPPSPEDQLQMALMKLRWLEQSRTQCENSLADMWAQAQKLEAKLKQAPPAPKDAPDASNQ